MQLEEEVFHLYVTKNMKDSRRIRLKSLLPQFICLNCVRRRWKKVESLLEWFFPLCSSVSAPRISWKFLFLDSNTQKTLQMMSQEAPPTALCCCIMGNVSSNGEVWSGVTLFADDDDDGKLGKRKNI